MNNADDRTITRRLATACAVIMALAATGCGNKGGLVLPEKPPVQSQEEATPAKDAGDQGTSTDKSTQQPKGYR
jgi:predicted small lipoprotein YifL